MNIWIEVIWTILKKIPMWCSHISPFKHFFHVFVSILCLICSIFLEAVCAMDVVYDMFPVLTCSLRYKVYTVNLICVAIIFIKSTCEVLKTLTMPSFELYRFLYLWFNKNKRRCTGVPVIVFEFRPDKFLIHLYMLFSILCIKCMQD